MNASGVAVVVGFACLPLGLILYPQPLVTQRAQAPPDEYPITMPLPPSPNWVSNRQLADLFGQQSALLDSADQTGEEAAAGPEQSVPPTDMRAFAAAMGMAAGRGERSPPRPPSFVLPNDREVLQLDFDLDNLAGPGEVIELSKEVYRGANLAGRIDIQIDGSGVIRVQSDDLSPMVAELSLPRLSYLSGAVSLNELRDAGIDLRYDPIGDRLLLN